MMPYESPILDSADPLVLIRARLIDGIRDLLRTDQPVTQDDVSELVDRLFYKPTKALEVEGNLAVRTKG